MKSRRRVGVSESTLRERIVPDAVLSRRRHVKCDENKPACHRCLKWRGTCEGYEERLASQSRTKQEPDTKRSQSQETDVAQLTATGPSEQIPQWYPALANETMKLLSRPSDLIYASSPSTPQPSTSPSSGSLVNELPSTAIPQHSGLEGPFWIQTVPGLLRANPSVRLANLAIHALIDSKRPQWVEEGPSLPGRDSYSRALRYHGEALGAVREKPANRESLQSATLCCLFFIIFEMMNGDVNAAQAHMYNGCRMMDELRGGGTNRPSTNGIESMLCRELQKALRFVAMQVQGAIGSFGEIKSEAEVEVKTEWEAEAEAEVRAGGSSTASVDGVVIKQEPRTPLPTD